MEAFRKTQAPSGLTETRFEKQLKNKLLQKSNDKLTEEAFLVKSFKFFDIYGKGELAFPDFHKAMEKIGLYYTHEVPRAHLILIQELEPLFNYYDKNGSGSLDYKEFSEIIFGAGSKKGCLQKESVQDLHKK